MALTAGIVGLPNVHRTASRLVAPGPRGRAGRGDQPTLQAADEGPELRLERQGVELEDVGRVEVSVRDLATRAADREVCDGREAAGWAVEEVTGRSEAIGVAVPPEGAADEGRNGRPGLWSLG